MSRKMEETTARGTAALFEKFKKDAFMLLLCCTIVYTGVQSSIEGHGWLFLVAFQNAHMLFLISNAGILDIRKNRVFWQDWT